MNLTRFSLFFPEKREFFLENQGIFTFGNNSFGRRRSANTSDVPLLFYSRRIGLAGQPRGADPRRRPPDRTGRPVSARRWSTCRPATTTAAGARATNFSVVRVKRDILRRSSVGAAGSRRGRSRRRCAGSNQVYGVDGTFAFFKNLTFNTYLGQDAVGQGSTATTSATARRWTTPAIATACSSSGSSIGPELQPGGRVPAPQRHAQELRAVAASARGRRRSRRSASSRASAQFTYIEDGAGRLRTRIADGEFGDRVPEQRPVQRRAQRRLRAASRAVRHRARRASSRSAATTSPPARIGYTLGQQRPFSGTCSSNAARSTTATARR